MVRQEGDLPFSFTLGSCNTFTAPSVIALVCFDLDNQKQCHL